MLCIFYRYDNVLILRPISLFHSKKFPGTKKFNAILDGSSVKRIFLPEVHITITDSLDLIGGSCSLSKFAQSMQIPVSKDIFPHSLNVTGSDFLSQTDLPASASQWVNGLTGEIPAQSDVDAVRDQMRREGWTVREFLIHYLKKDVLVQALAVLKFSDIIFSAYSVHPLVHRKLSISSMAAYALQLWLYRTKNYFFVMPDIKPLYHMIRSCALGDPL